MESFEMITYGTRTILYELPAGRLTARQKRALKAVSETVKQEPGSCNSFDRDAVISTVALDRSVHEPLIDLPTVIKQHLEMCESAPALGASLNQDHEQHPLRPVLFLAAQEPKVTATLPMIPFLQRECTLVFTGCDDHLRRRLNVAEMAQRAGVDLEWFGVCSRKRLNAKVMTASTTFATAISFLEIVEKCESKCDDKLSQTINARNKESQSQSERAAADAEIKRPSLETRSSSTIVSAGQRCEKLQASRGENCPQQSADEYFDALEYLGKEISDECSMESDGGKVNGFEEPDREWGFSSLLLYLRRILRRS